MIRRVGLNQRFTSAGSVQARNTRSGAALSWRVAVTVLGISILLFQECLQGIHLLVPESLVAQSPAGDLAQRCGTQLEEVFPPRSAPLDQPGALQDFEVRRHRIQRYAQAYDHIGDPGRPT